MSKIDTFIVTVGMNRQCNGLKTNETYIYWEGKLIETGPPIIDDFDRSFKVLGKPGKYWVSCEDFLGYNFDFEFEIVFSPVGITDNSYEAQRIIIAPNPTKDKFTINDPNHFVERAFLYNSQGKMIKELIDFDSTLTLENEPVGIYFIYLATRSKRIIIKKLLIY